MKLFRHYKNKPYTYIGLARHSETLEEMVIYETRYENALGKVWVRPKEMFFESVEINGKKTARFLEVPLKIGATTQVTETEINLIGQIMKAAFGDWDAKRFNTTFQKHSKFYLLMAFIDEKLVGFKIGYERDSQNFYSWLGGVTPEYRGLGIATDLMKTQHEWCRLQGYKKIATKTQNRFQAMLILNIRHGFEILSTDPTDQDGLKIIMEKKL